MHSRGTAVGISYEMVCKISEECLSAERRLVVHIVYPKLSQREVNYVQYDGASVHVVSENSSSTYLQLRSSRSEVVALQS